VVVINSEKYCEGIVKKNFSLKIEKESEIRDYSSRSKLKFS